MMDLLELNDVYCKDKARIKKEKLFEKDISVEYSFVPTEDSIFSPATNTPIDAIVNHPFKGAHSTRLGHDLSSYTDIVNDIVCTPWYDNTDGFNYWLALKDRMELYDQLVATCLQYHPDVMFSDILPGMTVAMSTIRNPNYSFERLYYTIPRVSPKYTTDNGLPVDSRALSLVYIKTNGSKLYGYGPLIFFGRGISSIPDDLKVYLLSSVHLVCRFCDTNIPGGNGEGWKNLRTSCLILYEDSLERIVKAIENEEQVI